MRLRLVVAVAAAVFACIQSADPVRAEYEDLIGPLGDSLDQQLQPEWQAAAQDGWFVLRNDQADNAEQALTATLGPAPQSGRITSVAVSISSKEQTASVGIMVRDLQERSLCVMEVTAAAAANLFCILGKEMVEIATVPNAAKLDGSDVIEMIELPDGARFFLNGQPIGDLPDATALGAEVGVMAYDTGTFGIADFRVTFPEPDGEATASGAPAGQPGGSGLPPRGGSGGGTAENPPSEEAPQDTGEPTLASIMGPLADVIGPSEKREGWELYLQDDWLIMENATREGEENYFSVAAGPVGEAGRLTRLKVAMAPVDGWTIEEMPHSAVGIIVENRQENASCLGEITGAGDGLLLCFGADGAKREVGRISGIARLDGSDVIELLELPGRAQFLVNGEVLGQVDGDPAFGGDIGVVAYERGRFFLGGFSILNDLNQVGSEPTGETAGTSGGGQTQTGGLTGPLPMFDGDSSRITATYLGVMTGIFLHEFGHALIGELQIPSTGPEEDAVDIFSALRISSPAALQGPDEDATRLNQNMAVYAALQWYYSGMVREQNGETVPWQDEHTADLKRFRNTFCVMYGGNPDLFAPLAQTVGMDERTLYRCEEEFNKQNRAWRTILAPYTRVSALHPEGLQPADAPGAQIIATFEPSNTRVGDFVKQVIGDSGTKQAYLDGIAANFVLPRPINVTFRDCGELNAWYDPREGTITMCYDLVEYIVVMISDIEMGTVNGEAAGGTPPVQPGGGDTGGAPLPAGDFGGDTEAGSGGNPGGGAFDELQDMGMPETTELFLAPYVGATPVSNPYAQVLTTEGLAGLVNEGGNMLLIDTSGRGDSLPGALVITDAGRDGSLNDSFQKMMDQFLTEQTGGDKQMPVIFFGAGMQDRSAYNAALRAGAIGWNAYWYRGGIEAWVANDLPLSAP